MAEVVEFSAGPTAAFLHAPPHETLYLYGSLVGPPVKRTPARKGKLSASFTVFGDLVDHQAWTYLTMRRTRGRSFG
jgi:hypothetical protein